MFIFDRIYLKHWKHGCYCTHDYWKLSCLYCISWSYWMRHCGRMRISKPARCVIVLGSVYYRNSLVAVFSALKCCNWRSDAPISIRPACKLSVPPKANRTCTSWEVWSPALTLGHFRLGLSRRWQALTAQRWQGVCRAFWVISVERCLRMVCHHTLLQHDRLYQRLSRKIFVKSCGN